jgi:hypothetical protein
MSTRITDGAFRDAFNDGAQGDERAVTPNGAPDNSLLAEDPLTGLPWTETLLPLVTNWAGTAAVHAVCLHFVGLGILANIPEYQSSHSLLREATDRITTLMEDDDRLTRFSGNKLMIFSKRSEAGVRALLVEIADRLETFGMDVDGRHLPEVRVGMAMLGGRGRSAITVEAMNSLMSDAAGVTVPMAEVVTPKAKDVHPDGAEAAAKAPIDLPEPTASAPPGPPERVVAADVPAAGPAPAPTWHPPVAPAPPAVPVAPPAHQTPVAPQAHQTPDALPAPREYAAAEASSIAPEISDQTPERVEETETTMITRGHPERTPIRPAPEAPVSVAGPRDAMISEHRLILKGVDVVVTGMVATAVVDLDFSGQRVRGKAIGRSSDTHHFGLVGEALARAVTDLLPAGHGAVFRQAVSTATDAGDVVVTVLEFLTPDRTEYLFGVAPTEGEPVAGVAKSILNAVNHPAAMLLASAG